MNPTILQAEQAWIQALQHLRFDKARELRAKYNLDIRRLQHIYFQQIQKLWYQLLITRKLQVAINLRQETQLQASLLKVGITGYLQNYITNINQAINKEPDKNKKNMMLVFRHNLEKEIL